MIPHSTIFCRSVDIHISALRSATRASRFRRTTKVSAAALALAFVSMIAASAVHATDWYVDGLNGSDQNDGSKQHPFQNPAYILTNAQLLQPGDTVHLLPTVTYIDPAIEISGTSSAPITVTGAPKTMTEIEGDGNLGSGFWIQANYVRIQYFDVLQAPGEAAGGMAISQSHHVELLHNVICNAGLNGVTVNYSDYVTISGNIVCGSGRYNAQGIYGSGISMWEDRDIDNNTGVKMIVSDNYVYGNANAGAPGDTDGNGIIVDDNRNTQTGGKPYRGKTVIQNNLVFGNGGRGIHVYSSDHVVISGNSTYHNNLDPYLQDYNPGEIDGYSCGDIIVTDNIMYSDGAVRSQSSGSDYDLKAVNCNGRVWVAANMGYNDPNDSSKYSDFSGSSHVVQSHRFPTLWADPKYANASTNPAKSNLQILAGSPALGAGMTGKGAPRRDILGRRRRPPITIGAYEFPFQ